MHAAVELNSGCTKKSTSLESASPWRLGLRLRLGLELGLELGFEFELGFELGLGFSSGDACDFVESRVFSGLDNPAGSSTTPLLLLTRVE